MHDSLQDELEAIGDLPGDTNVDKDDIEYYQVTWEDLDKAMMIHASGLAAYAEENGYTTIDITAVTRGGAVPATILSHYLEALINDKASSLENITIEYIDQEEMSDSVFCSSKEEGLHVIVDDIWDSGKTLSGCVSVDSDEPVFVIVVVLNTLSEVRPGDCEFQLMTHHQIEKQPNMWVLFPWENLSSTKDPNQ